MAKGICANHRAIYICPVFFGRFDCAIFNTKHTRYIYTKYWHDIFVHYFCTVFVHDILLRYLSTIYLRDAFARYLSMILLYDIFHDIFKENHPQYICTIFFSHYLFTIFHDIFFDIATRYICMMSFSRYFSLIFFTRLFSVAFCCNIATLYICTMSFSHDTLSHELVSRNLQCGDLAILFDCRFHTRRLSFTWSSWWWSIIYTQDLSMLSKFMVRENLIPFFIGICHIISLLDSPRLPSPYQCCMFANRVSILGLRLPLKPRGLSPDCVPFRSVAPCFTASNLRSLAQW